MNSPITGKKMTLKRDKRTLTFRKEEFIFFSHFFHCEDSGEQFTSTELDKLNLLQVHNQYRDKYNLPFPSEIKALRKEYALPANKMSEILGFGVNSYRNYENGEVPSISNGKLIQLIADPVKFLDMVNLCDSINSKEKSKIINSIENIILTNRKNSFAIAMEDYLLGSKLPDSLSGYMKPDLSKLTEMVKFFSERLRPWKTVLNKLLFYSDFLAYRKNCFSMSGVRYKAIKMGPVPNNYNSIYEFIANKKDIEINNIAFSENIFGYQFNKSTDKEFNPNIFNNSEIEILNLVCKTFTNMSTSEVIEFSHKEKAWLANEGKRNMINYNYAFDIVQL